MKKIAIKIFICLIFLGSIWFLYKKYIDYHMIQKVEKQPDIVFSTEFSGGDKGTYKYSVGKRIFCKNCHIVRTMKLLLL